MANKLQLDLSGGVNVTTTPLALSDNECEWAVNYDLDRFGALTKRSGYTQLGSQLTDNSVLGLYAYGDRDNLLAVINNASDTDSTLYRFNGATWDSKLTGRTANARARFADFVGRTYYVNGSDKMVTSANGGTLSTWDYTSAPDSGDNFQPKYVAVYKDRVYAARQGGSGEDSRLYWSGKPDSNAVSWDITADYADIDPDNQNSITGLENNGNRLLVFKSNAMYRWQFGAVEADRIIGVGAFEQEAIATNFEVGITFFFGEQGIYAYSPAQGRPSLISRKIQRILDTRGNTNWNASQLTCDRDNLYVAGIDSITLDGRQILNPWFVYNITLDAWTLYSTPEQVTALTSYLNSTNNPTVIFGTASGNIYEFDPDVSYDGTTTTPIATDFISKEYLLNFPQKARIKEIDITSLTTNRTQVLFDVDRKDEWTSLGEVQGRFSTHHNTTHPRGNTARVRLSSNNTGTQMVEGYNIEYEPVEVENPKQSYGRKAQQHR